MKPFEAKLQGLAQLTAKLGGTPQHALKVTGAGLYALGNNIKTGSMQLAPIDTGALRASHFVTLPVVKPSMRDSAVIVEVGCGGPAAPYAIYQHERVDFQHAEGEAKFLEKSIDKELPDAPALVAKVAEAVLRQELGKKVP